MTKTPTERDWLKSRLDANLPQKEYYPTQSPSISKNKKIGIVFCGSVSQYQEERMATLLKYFEPSCIYMPASTRSFNYLAQQATINVKRSSSIRDLINNSSWLIILEGNGSCPYPNYVELSVELVRSVHKGFWTIPQSPKKKENTDE